MTNQRPLKFHDRPPQKVVEMNGFLSQDELEFATHLISQQSSSKPSFSLSESLTRDAKRIADEVLKTRSGSPPNHKTFLKLLPPPSEQPIWSHALEAFREFPIRKATAFGVAIQPLSSGKIILVVIASSINFAKLSSPATEIRINRFDTPGILSILNRQRKSMGLLPFVPSADIDSLLGRLTEHAKAADEEYARLAGELYDRSQAGVLVRVCQTEPVAKWRDNPDFLRLMLSSVKEFGSAVYEADGKQQILILACGGAKAR
jgi:hypothetical protein